LSLGEKNNIIQENKHATKMNIFISSQVGDNESDPLRVEIVRTLTAGNKRFILWAYESEDKCLVHEFSSIVSIDVFSKPSMAEFSLILLTKLDEEESSTIESVSLGKLTEKNANDLLYYVKSSVVYSG
jgi:hypothetical protein